MVPKEPRSVHPESVTRFSQQAGEHTPGLERPPASALTLVIAGSFFFLILALGIPALFSAFPERGERPPATAPTARQLNPTTAPATAAPAELAAPSAVAAPASPEAPPADAAALPATLPAGAAPGDQSLTIYQGWPYQVSGARAGDACELQVWPDGRGPVEQVWIVCALLEL